MGEMGKSTVIFGAWEFKMSNRYLSQLGQRPRQAPMCKSLRGASDKDGDSETNKSYPLLYIK